MQPVQDLTIEDRVSRTQYQFTVETADPDELGVGVPNGSSSACAQVPQLADVASDLQDGGLQAYVDIDRATASRLGITPAAIDNALYNAFGQRLVSTIFTQSNQYRVVLEVKPEFQRGPGALDDIYVTSTVPGQPPQQVPLSTIARVVERPTPLAINHIGQFPAATISFNLAPRRVARRRRQGDRGGAARARRCRRACRSTSRARRSRSARRSPTSCG